MKYPVKRPVNARVAMYAFLAAMVAAPAAAVQYPNEPLQTASRVAPNVLFVLDDSGSMAFDAMPANTINDTNPRVGRSYAHNAVYYNPATTYLPWRKADGSRMAGGTSYRAAYGSFNLVGGTTIDLSDPNSCARFNRNQANATNDEPAATVAGTTVCGGVQAFLVPKDTSNTTSAYLGNNSNFWYYRINEDRTIRRGEWGTVSTTGSLQWVRALTSVGVYNGTNNNMIQVGTFRVPTGASSLRIDMSGNNGDADLYVRQGDWPTTGNNNGRSSTSGTSNESITINSPAAGTWYVSATRRRNNNGDNFTGVSVAADVQLNPGNRCDPLSAGTPNFVNCTNTTLPNSNRNADAELENYATWFSYHRTRMKAAKAGAGDAFSELGSDVRVGYRTIWGRNGGTTPGNRPTQGVPIPVDYNDGLFSDLIVRDDRGVITNTYDNRTQWYQRLYGTIGQSGTPLHNALDQAGQYYSSSAANGPYGPQSGVDQYACRQNFTILTTDGFWNTYTDDNNNTFPNEDRERIGNSDNTAGATITGPYGQSFTYSPEAPYRDNHSVTLADVAMHYWKNDLRTDSHMVNVVPTSSKNPAFWQHMVTFGISIGLQGSLNQETAWPELEAGDRAWPNPMPTENATRIDDLWHAAVNSRGEFIAASNPEEFSRGLQAALASIVERTGSFANLSASSTSLRTGTQAFQASFVSGVWTGELRAYPVTSNGINTAVAPSWSASALIPAPASRNILTWSGTPGDGATFPTEAQTTALARGSVTGAQNAAYLRGTRTLELSNGGTLRNRNHLLGSIVHSSPAYDPATETVYIGANDGMLHAFDARASGGGAERFAYVPGGINLSDLASYSDTAYSHRYFVDGPITLSRRDQTPGETWLVGTLGRGGNGLFALDVTNPSSFATTDVKWEATQTPGNNMGRVLGQPIIARLNSGNMGVIVPNGINSPNQRAALLIYDLEEGTLLAEIDTGVGSDTASNGLSAPTVRDVDGNGTVDYVYAGDLQGNLWRFDISAALPATWEEASSRVNLYEAGASQPITSAPSLARNPNTYELWVFFGTGRFMTNGDIGDNTVQAVYGLRDRSTTIASSELVERRIQALGTKDGRVVRGFETAAPMPVDKAGWFMNLLDPAVPPATTATPQGERVVSDVQVMAGILIFSSILPSEDPCQPGGSGYLNAMDAFTGTSLSYSLFDLDGDGDYHDEVIVVGEGDNAVRVPIGSLRLSGMGSLGAIFSGEGGGSGDGQICVNISDASIECDRIREARKVGRVSWHEMVRN